MSIKTCSIDYEFFPPPKAVKREMRRTKLTGNEYKAMDTILDIVTSFPEGRKNFEKELSSSYIAQNLNLCESSILKAISGLIRKGFLEVVKQAKRGVGRILRIIFPEKRLPAKTAGHSPDDMLKQHAISAGKQETYLPKNKQQEPCSVSSFNEHTTENIPKAPVKPQEAKLEDKNFASAVKVDNNSTGPAEVSTIVKEISDKVLVMGVQELKNRGITEINIALQEIESEMALRGKIKYPENYFISLCQKKNNWQNIVKKTAEDKETREEMEKRQKQEAREKEAEEEERRAIIAENLKYNSMAEELKVKYPAEFKKAAKAVEMELRKQRVYDFMTEFQRNQCIIELFRMMFPEQI